MRFESFLCISLLVLKSRSLFLVGSERTRDDSFVV
jgi:hypothetical protein